MKTHKKGLCTMKYTETPWEVDRDNPDLVMTRGPDGTFEYIAQFDPAEFTSMERTDDENHGNAARAAIAVNAHDGLVAELRKVLAVMDSHEAAWWLGEPARGGFDRIGMESALKKATKEQT